MKAFVCLSILAAASAAPAGVLVGHHAPVVAVGAGQTSHQSVSTAHGEQRSLVQAKAFGATHGSVSQVDNFKGLAEVQPSIGANRPVAVGKAAVVPLHSVAPVTHGVHAPVIAHAPVAHAVHAAPVVAHAVHAAPVVAHAAPAYHAPVVAAPAYHAPAPAYKAETYADEVSPYTYTYAVADDYSKAAFNAEETSDGASNVQGSYRVALPDGRIQTVTYTSNGYDGYVADVTYEGTAAYPEAPAPGYKAAPAYAAPVVAHAAPAYHAPVVAHAAPVVAHAVHAAPVVAHAAPVVAHAPLAVAHGVHAPVAHTPVSAAVAPVNYGANKPVNGYGHGQVSHQSVSKPLQGEHRATTQSKAFGSHAAVVADAPNRLHGAKGVVAHAVHAPVIAHAAAPVAVAALG